MCFFYAVSAFVLLCSLLLYAPLSMFLCLRLPIEIGCLLPHLSSLLRLLDLSIVLGVCLAGAWDTSLFLECSSLTL